MPTDPEYCKTPLGDTKIPDPTIIPIIIEVPSSKLNCLLSFVSSAVILKKKKKMVQVQMVAR